MKNLLARIVDYKLTPYNFLTFVDTLTTLVNEDPKSQRVYHKAELKKWLNELRALCPKQPLSESDQQIIEAILYKIEELLVYEMVLMPKDLIKIQNKA